MYTLKHKNAQCEILYYRIQLFKKKKITPLRNKCYDIQLPNSQSQGYVGKFKQSENRKVIVGHVCGEAKTLIDLDWQPKL